MARFWYILWDTQWVFKWTFLCLLLRISTLSSWWCKFTDVPKIMHPNLAVILRQFNYSKNSFAILVQKKVDLMHKSPSRVTISQPPNRVRKDTEQQSEPPPAFKRKITWKNVHRWVEQTPEEPLRKTYMGISNMYRHTWAYAIHRHRSSLGR